MNKSYYTPVRLAEAGLCTCTDCGYTQTFKPHSGHTRCIACKNILWRIVEPVKQAVSK